MPLLETLNSPANKDETGFIGQYKINAIAAKHLHQWCLNPLKLRSTLTDSLAFVVPILYFPIRYALKGTQLQVPAEYIWEGLAAVLSALAIVKVFFKWQENVEKHSRLRDKNIEAVTQCDMLLRQETKFGEPDFKYFVEKMNQLEGEDRELLGNVKTETQRAAYREALKEVVPGGADCPVCGASPWKYSPGACQVCGNTPVQGEKGIQQ